jgi:triacylglycerol lipase
MGQNGHREGRELESVALPIWQELLVGVEIVYLRISPVYWGFGVPHGDGSAVVVVPGFLGTDLYLGQLRSWLRRIGYKAYDSGIGLNAECPNLLMREHLDQTIARAQAETGKKVHLIGHSLGGMLARAEAVQRPKRIASVITLATPITAVACHPSIIRTVESVRQHILARHGADVLPACYTGACTCDFLESLVCARFPRSVPQTAVYTKTDGVVDWRVCRTGNPRVDVEVRSTHIGLVFSPLVYSVIAERLAQVQARKERPRAARAAGTRADYASRAPRQHRRAG